MHCIIKDFLFMQVISNSDQYILFVRLFVCLFLCFLVFSSHSRMFPQMKTFYYRRRLGVQILTYTRHSLAWSSGGSLACHTFCDTSIMVISKDPWISHLLCRSGSFTICFNDLGISRLGFKHLAFRMQGKRSNGLGHHLDDHY